MDTTLDRVVAVKLLAEPYVADDSARRRFAREARAAARVSSDPNIVTIFDVGDAGGRPYIVMEYIAGTLARGAAALRSRSSRRTRCGGSSRPAARSTTRTRRASSTAT